MTLTPEELRRFSSLTPSQLEILQHSLGVDKYGRGSMYRNHFCASGDDEDVCRSLVALGLMQQHATTEMFPYFNCSVTELGKTVVRECSLKLPPRTRSGKRYDEWLDADCGMKFAEWIKAKYGRCAVLSAGEGK